jgi:hypothetical protein
MTVRHIFEISEDDHARAVSHARDHWWTLDFANAFVSPGVNSRGELVYPRTALRTVGSGITTQHSNFTELKTVFRVMAVLAKRGEVANEHFWHAL